MGIALRHIPEVQPRNRQVHGEQSAPRYRADIGGYITATPIPRGRDQGKPRRDDVTTSIRQRQVLPLGSYVTVPDTPPQG